MKKFTLPTIVFLIISIIGFCHAGSPIMDKNAKQESTKIELFGSFPTNKTRSLFEPIVVMQYSEYLEVNFCNDQLGVISIEIEDEANNVIYCDVIDTYAIKIYQIFLSSYKEGNYYITFTNSQNQYMRGGFVIKK